MRVALFVPCYIDQLYPHVAIATLELLEKCGCHVDFPLEQTCCGQPMANAGFEKKGEGALLNFIQNFEPYDVIVAPSGSCVLHVRDHLKHVSHSFSGQVFELCEFLTDVMHVTGIEGNFPNKVGLHASCHGLRGLRLGTSSELNLPAENKARRLLAMLEGVEIASLNRADECCGFGGTFAVTEEAVSVKMGRDRIEDHLSQDVEVITGTDVSCLMHLDGLIRREKKPLRVMHIAELLNVATKLHTITATV